MKYLAGVLIACIFLSLTFNSVAQVPAQLVILHVRVTDTSDKAVLDVDKSSFQVTEDGVPQKIELFINNEVPLSYGLVIDASGSLHSQFQQVLDAAHRIVDSNKPADQTFVIRFVSSAIQEVMQEPTSDKVALFKALDDFYIEGGQSAVVDAVYLSAQKLAGLKYNDAELRRKVLILVTDGDDRSSFYKQEQLFQLLGSNDNRPHKRTQR
jgi:VWFA-related protein